MARAAATAITIRLRKPSSSTSENQPVCPDVPRACLPSVARFMNVRSSPGKTERPHALVRGKRCAVDVQSYIRAIPDFPLPGILFRDITPLLKDKQAFKAAIDLFVDKYKQAKIDHVVGIEARGYMLGAPLAYSIGAGFVPVRKPGKLPYSKLSESYALEYGTNSLEIHADA